MAEPPPDPATCAIGQRVVLCGDHPWAGCVGTVIRAEKTPWGWQPIVRLDDAAGVPYQHECFVMRPDNAREL